MNTIKLNRKVFILVLFVCVLIAFLWINSRRLAPAVQHGNFVPGSSRDRIDYLNTKRENANTHGRLNTQQNTDGTVAAVLVIACNRPEVERCLDSLLRYRPSEKTPAAAARCSRKTHRKQRTAPRYAARQSASDPRRLTPVGNGRPVPTPAGSSNWDRYA